VPNLLVVIDTEAEICIEAAPLPNQSIIHSCLIQIENSLKDQKIIDQSSNHSCLIQIENSLKHQKIINQTIIHA
jgi:hypothetical protein